VFACTRKDRLRTRSGSPYLALVLRDRTGSVPARAFRDADVLGGRFERGDVVRVAGRVGRFRDELVVELADIGRVETNGSGGDGSGGSAGGGSGHGSGLGSGGSAGDDSGAGEIDPASFLPTAYRDLDELDGFLEHLAGEVYDRRFRALLDSLLADRGLRAAWRRAPCTRAGHHAYLGGLLEHTVAVATLVQDVCQLHPKLRPDLLLTAALVHDLGRTREFTYGAEIGLSTEGRLLGHLAIGQRMLVERIDELGLDEERALGLLHCVLCHHGAASAPGGRFGSAEAVALYRINALDAGVKGVLEHGLGGPAGA
jgi:3'-5' exoribonuclease